VGIGGGTGTRGWDGCGGAGAARAAAAAAAVPGPRSGRYDRRGAASGGGAETSAGERVRRRAPATWRGRGREDGAGVRAARGAAAPPAAVRNRGAMGSSRRGGAEKHLRERGRGGGHRRRGGDADGTTAPACERRAERQRRRRPCGCGIERQREREMRIGSAPPGGKPNSHQTRGLFCEIAGSGAAIHGSQRAGTRRHGQARVGTGRGRCRRGRSWCEETAGSFNRRDVDTSTEIGNKLIIVSSRFQMWGERIFTQVSYSKAPSYIIILIM
jgi:hypothetical protein